MGLERGLGDTRVTGASRRRRGPRVVRMWVLPAGQVGRALGHDVDQYGHAYARVFWDPIRDNGGTLTSGRASLSVIISHESKEARRPLPVRSGASSPATPRRRWSCATRARMCPSAIAVAAATSR